MASDYIMRLVQKKLLDKNYQITQEEVEQATDNLNDRVYMAQLYLDMLNREQKLLNEFVLELKSKMR